ncbi:putative tyrosinase-like protein tyr-3 [Aplysia californica]|uniref:Tyrosinase-like protein tyr-3 n=1 Tax=Aplysia californica TaxID=6500 RepID=A0ABM1A342_APLCA|nr:putative tyrosinase-like protein tyr-3 [Aplysia californica]
MLVYCKQSCNKCGNGGGTTGGGGGGGGSTCRDLHYNCPRWRQSGYCRGYYSTYMKTNCRASCRFCSARSSTGHNSGSGNRVEEGGDGRAGPTWGCPDYHTNCRSWAAMGECQRNSAYMSLYCKQSCNLCARSSSHASPSGTSCTDNSEHCSYWAGIGECTRNAAYMTGNCRSSCGLC